MDTSSRQFGLLVAYLLPGFIALAGIARLVPAVARWLQPTIDQGGSGIGPPVYAVLGATAVGMVLSCIRWVVVDHIHQWTGVTAPDWDVDRLEARLDAFNQLVEYHYRYYQFYSNTLVALLWTYVVNRWEGIPSSLTAASDVGVVILCAVLFAGSRDTLRKYYTRTERLIGPVAEKDTLGDVMTNGCHHDQPVGRAPKKPAVTKPKAQRVTPKREPAKEKAATPVN